MDPPRAARQQTTVTNEPKSSLTHGEHRGKTPGRTESDELVHGKPHLRRGMRPVGSGRQNSGESQPLREISRKSRVGHSPTWPRDSRS